MNSEEIIMAKKYVEGAYPQMQNKDKDNGADIVWLDMLKKYPKEGVIASIKAYIESGNPYPPTLADIIKGYKAELDSHKTEILSQMISDGFFDDPETTDMEIAEWNKDKRIDKAKYWLTLDSKTWPQFFRDEVRKYYKYIELGGKENVKQLV